MAAERHARACYGMEVDPLYCDVVLARWERFSGKVAKRVEVGAGALGPKDAQRAE